MRSKGTKLTDWTHKDQVLLDTVKSCSTILEGLREFSEKSGVSLDSTRNRWYSSKLKAMRGETSSVNQRVKGGKYIGRKAASILKPRTKRNSKNKDNEIEDNKIEDNKVEDNKIEHTTEASPRVPSEAEIKLTNDLKQAEVPNEPFVPFVQFQIDNSITVEAKEAINDVRDSLAFFNEGMNRLIQSNTNLIRESENTKSEYNRLLRNYKELEETYAYMLRMINQARIQALQEEDKKNSLMSSGVNVVSSKTKNDVQVG